MTIFCATTTNLTKMQNNNFYVFSQCVQYHLLCCNIHSFSHLEKLQALCKF